MVIYEITPSEMEQFSLYANQKKAKEAEIQSHLAAVQQLQSDLLKLEGCIHGHAVNIAVANGALAKGASLDSLTNLNYDLAKRQLTWPEPPQPAPRRAEPKQKFKRKKK